MSNSSFNINPHFKATGRQVMEAAYYADGVVSGDRYILGEAITIVESLDPEKKLLGKKIIALLPRNKQSRRLTITGAPGVGKSTFIENFGTYLLGRKDSLAVLAVDPSSHQYKGSVLGDKTRMATLAMKPNVFIRPSSAGDLLGGVARGTKEAILLCEAAGYKYIFIETVGVGQSEYWGGHISDFTIYLLQPGSGDELQGIKRGILEMADLVVVNKSDRDQKNLALLTAQNYRSILDLLPSKISGCNRHVLNVSSLELSGFEALLDHIDKLYIHCRELDLFNDLRQKQESFWFHAMLKEEIYDICISNPVLSEFITSLTDQINTQKIDSITTLGQMKNFFQSFFDMLRLK